MPPIVRQVLPFVVLNFVLIAVALVLVFTGHHTAAIVVMVVDAANIMFLRYRMFRWQRERRRG
jgi:hypothetical protein